MNTAELTGSVRTGNVSRWAFSLRLPAAAKPMEIRLDRGALWSGRPNAGQTVRCRFGRLWITREGDAEDVVLEAGESYESRGGGSVVIEALATSLLEFR